MNNVISAGRLAIQILPSDLLKFSLNLQTDLLIIYVADDLVSALFRFVLEVILEYSVQHKYLEQHYNHHHHCHNHCSLYLYHYH